MKFSVEETRFPSFKFYENQLFRPPICGVKLTYIATLSVILLKTDSVLKNLKIETIENCRAAIEKNFAIEKNLSTQLVQPESFVEPHFRKLMTDKVTNFVTKLKKLGQVSEVIRWKENV